MIFTTKLSSQTLSFIYRAFYTALFLLMLPVHVTANPSRHDILAAIQNSLPAYLSVHSFDYNIFQGELETGRVSIEGKAYYTRDLFSPDAGEWLSYIKSLNSGSRSVANVDSSITTPITNEHIARALDDVVSRNNITLFKVATPANSILLEFFLDFRFQKRVRDYRFSLTDRSYNDTQLKPFLKVNDLPRRNAFILGGAGQSDLVETVFSTAEQFAISDFLIKRRISETRNNLNHVFSEGLVWIRWWPTVSPNRSTVISHLYNCNILGEHENFIYTYYRSSTNTFNSHAFHISCLVDTTPKEQQASGDNTSITLQNTEQRSIHVSINNGTTHYFNIYVVVPYQNISPSAPGLKQLNYIPNTSMVLCAPVNQDFSAYTNYNFNRAVENYPDSEYCLMKGTTNISLLNDWEGFSWDNNAIVRKPSVGNYIDLSNFTFLQR